MLEVRPRLGSSLRSRHPSPGNATLVGGHAEHLRAPPGVAKITSGVPPHRRSIVGDVPGAPFTPMLATAGDLPAGPGWAFELKWDGVRAIAACSGGRTRLFARRGN